MKRFTLQNPQTEIRQYKGRVIAIAFLIGILLLGLMARLIYLQVFQHIYYLTLSKQNLLTVAPIDPSRGLIYDRNGVLIAGNMPVFSLEVIPDKVKNIKQMLKDLSTVINLSDNDIQDFQKQLSQHRKFNPVSIKIKLSDQDMAAFAVNQYKFPGVFVQAHMVRYYPFNALMQPVLGYVGRINAEELDDVDSTNYSASNYIGKTGIEKYYETLLHGVVGIQQIQTSAQGDVVGSNQNRAAIAGQNLYLTIDSKLQALAQNAIKNFEGAVIIMDPRTGEILAFVSNPSFDPNLFVTGISNAAYHALQNDPARPLINRILQGEYPPGSTAKPFYAVGGLQAGAIVPSESIYDPGIFKLPNSPHIYHDHDWERGGHGIVNLEKAIIVSCDTFFFHFMQRMGIDQIDNILKTFGFGSPTGIDTYTEKKGLVPSPEWKKRIHHQDWFPGDTVSVGIGQGYLLVTPMQLSTAFMKLVDKGKGYQPHLLLKKESPSGVIDQNNLIPMTPINSISEDNWNLVLKSMREVVSNPAGTAYRSGHDAPYTYGGKTGTAQVFSLKGNQKDKAYLLPKKLRDHSWFMSFAPADNPKIIMIIFLEHGGEGEAPVVTRQILDGYFKNEQTTH